MKVIKGDTRSLDNGSVGGSRLFSSKIQDAGNPVTLLA